MPNSEGEFISQEVRIPIVTTVDESGNEVLINYNPVVEFVYQEDDEIMTGLIISGKYSGKGEIGTSMQVLNEMRLSIVAFVQAHSKTPFFTEEVYEKADLILSRPFQDFEFTLHGVHVTYNVEYSGYEPDTLWKLVAKDNGDDSYLTYEFKMELLEE